MYLMFDGAISMQKLLEEKWEVLSDPLLMLY